MNTPVLPEMIPSEWTAVGEAMNAESIVIPMPKGVDRCEVRLAVAPDGSWRYGFSLDARDELQAVSPQLAGDTFDSRLAALRSGIVAVGKRLNLLKLKKASAALEKFHDAVCALSDEPVVTSVAAAPSPLPKAVAAEVAVASIQANPENARRYFDEAAITELCASITREGLQQPIVVRRLLTDELDELPGVTAAVKAERYELVAGERRLRAFQRMKRETIPCMVLEGVTRAQCKGAGLAENIQREGLNPIEEARGYADLMQSEGLTQEQCADRVGKSRPVVANALRVLALPEAVVALLEQGKLTMAHGVALARFKAWPLAVKIMAEEAVKQKATATELERGVPFSRQLREAGVIARVELYDVGHEWPAGVKKSDPRFVKESDYCTWCFDAAWWAGIVTDYKAKEKAELDVAAAKRKAAEEKARKTPQKIKSLDELPHSAYRVVEKEDQSLLSLVPESAQLDVSGGDLREGNVTICTKPDLYRKINDAVAALKKEDREKKLPALYEAAAAKLEKLKKLGGRELILLVYLAQVGDDYNAPRLDDEAVQKLGVKLPRKAINKDYEGNRMNFTSEGLAALSEQTDPVTLCRVIILSYLKNLFTDRGDAGFDFSLSPEGDAGVLLKWILEVDDLGLLEETKAGQKQLTEAIKAEEWYQKAIAAIDAEASNTPAKGKGGK